MELEAELGFRSSFNFVPEGPYLTPKQLRDDIIANGFEVGIHDLRHDGQLYENRTIFRDNARKINGYLKEWNAVGFRSAFMLHNFDWLHDLDVLYDASSFDTDPFEPQPDGVNTIFPFWVPRRSAVESINTRSTTPILSTLNPKLSTIRVADTLSCPTLSSKTLLSSPYCSSKQSRSGARNSTGSRRTAGWCS